MKTASKYAVLCTWLTLACAASAKDLPDLVVLSVESANLESGVVKVVVKNQGAAPSAPFYLALRVQDRFVFSPALPKTKVFSPKIPGLRVGHQIELTVPTGFSLSKFKYEAIADRSNTVQESDETNNRRSGNFDGTP